MRLPPKFVEISTGEIEEAIDAHSIQPYYTVLLADECGMALGHSATAEELTFTADVIAA
jgi:histidine phosphotransferase ChpT